MKKLPWFGLFKLSISISMKSDFLCFIDYSKFNDYNSGCEEVIRLRQHFASTYKVPPRLFETYISAVKGIKDTDKQIRNIKMGIVERNFYHGYWEDIFTHFPFKPTCKINILLNTINHKLLCFKSSF